MLSLFISYRREDDSGFVGRVYDRLVGEFGARSIFFDVDSIPGGTDFSDQIVTSIKRSDVVLVCIGRRWDPARLSSSGDFVRREIEEAFGAGRKVLPVLLGDTAEMPQPTDLPTSVEPLAVLNAVRVRDGRDFDESVRALVAELDALTLSAPVFRNPRRRRSGARGRRASRVVVGGKAFETRRLVFAACGALAVLVTGCLTVLVVNNIIGRDWTFNCDAYPSCTYKSATSVPLGIAALVAVIAAFGATVDRVVGVLVDTTRSARKRRTLYVAASVASVAVCLFLGRQLTAHSGIFLARDLRPVLPAIVVGLAAVGSMHSLRLCGPPSFGRIVSSPLVTSTLAFVLVAAVWLQLRTQRGHLYAHATSTVLMTAGMVLSATLITLTGPERGEVERLARVEGTHRRAVVAIGVVPVVLLGGYAVVGATSHPPDDALITRPLGDDASYAMAPRGDLVATAAYGESAAHIWSVDPFTTRELFTVAANSPDAMAFSDDSSRLATVGSDIRIWDTVTAQLVSRAAFPPDLYTGVIGGIAWSPDGKYVVVSAWGADYHTGGFSYVVDASSGAVVHEVPDGLEVAHAPTGDMFAVQGDARLDVWRYDESGIELTFTDQGEDCGRSLAWSPDTDGLLAYRCLGSLRVVRPADGSERFRYPMTDLVAQSAGNTAWAPDASRVVFATRQQNGDAQTCRIAVADLRSGDLSTLLSRQEPCGFGETSWSEDGHAIFVGDGRDVVRYDTDLARESRRLRGHPSDVRIAKVVESNGAQYLLSISSDGVFKSFDLST
jgi:Tol biopolymer transport system component